MKVSWSSSLEPWLCYHFYFQGKTFKGRACIDTTWTSQGLWWLCAVSNELTWNLYLAEFVSQFGSSLALRAGGTCTWFGRWQWRPLLRKVPWRVWGHTGAWSSLTFCFYGSWARCTHDTMMSLTPVGNRRGFQFLLTKSSCPLRLQRGLAPVGVQRPVHPVGEDDPGWLRLTRTPALPRRPRLDESASLRRAPYSSSLTVVVLLWLNPDTHVFLVS